ncbi:MAG: amine dehydrogenase large subunit [Steroidobacteraceae bacterium]
MNMRWIVLACLAAVPARSELPTDTLGQVETLPATYPPHWVLAQDSAFFHLIDGRVVVLDLDADSAQARYKGMFNTSLIAPFAQAVSRPEMYSADTFYSRGQRGDRTDVLTIIDKRTLAPIGEVALPTGKRASTIPQRQSLVLVNGERWALIFNLNPATSASVVDVVERKYLNDIPIPGCGLILPTGERGFSSLCADGTLYTVQLDEQAQIASTSRTARFFDVDKDALFEKPAWVGGTAYLPSFNGNLVPVDLRADKPRIGKAFSLLDKDTAGWRPGGMQLIGEDANGRIYILMHPEGREGSHKDPGAEVWVFDPLKKKRVQRIALEKPAISISLTRDGDAPMLVATTIDMTLAVYSATDGRFVREISGFGAETPFLVWGAR